MPYCGKKKKEMDNQILSLHVLIDFQIRSNYFCYRFKRIMNYLFQLINIKILRQTLLVHLAELSM